MKKRNIFIRYLVLLMMIATFAACSPSGDKTEQKANTLAEKVEEKAEQTEKAEGKNNLVKDEVKVKTDAKGEPKEPILVGRISYLEGQVLRYVPEKQEWVAVARDFPFGLDESLYAAKGGKAELIMPNNTRARIGDSTQIQLIVLKPDMTELDLATGIARFYNKGSDTELKVTSSFGYVLAPVDTVFDLVVGDNSIEVIVLKGTVDFVHSATETKYEVIAGSSALIADNRQVSSAVPCVNVAWERWNQTRDSMWAERLNMKCESVKNLPAGLCSYNYELDRYGRWENVYYEGEYRSLWRPVHVSAGWAPYTIGRWIDWYGDQCWIPDEPFGYVTHHYGSWAFVGSSWYWAPPAIGVSASIGPFFGVSFNWYPGRVAWIHHQGYVGWLPLAPGEVYYAHRYWGPESVVVGGVGLAGFGVGINSYRYLNHAVIVNQNNFYNTVNYRRVLVRNVNPTTIAANYRVAPVINDDVIRGYAANSKRFGFGAAGSGLRSEPASVERINHNRSMVSEHGEFKAKDLRDRVNGLGKGKFVEGSQIRRPGLAESGTMRHGGGAKITKAGRGEVSGGSKSKHGRSTSIKQRDSGGGKHDFNGGGGHSKSKGGHGGEKGGGGGKKDKH